MLPNEFTNEINCIDSLGKKQGWWILYKIKYNPIERPDKLAKGNYVPFYSYGMYKNNKKIGDWKTVENVHQVYERRIDNYYYGKDTNLVKSGFVRGGWNESIIYYNLDSTIIKSKSMVLNEEYPICIDCKKKSLRRNKCSMTYRKSIIKRFPFEFFEFELEKTFINGTKEKSKIELIKSKN